MKNKLLLSLWRLMVRVPRAIWQGQVSGQAHHTDAHLDFMSEDHHRVRDFAVRELPRVGQPLSAQFIAGRLNLPIARVTTILNELEQHMTFLFRGDGEAVTWAYPVTVDHTPHRVTFSTGEQIYAA